MLRSETLRIYQALFPKDQALPIARQLESLRTLHFQPDPDSSNSDQPPFQAELALINQLIGSLDTFQQKLVSLGLGTIQEPLTEKNSEICALACRVKEFPKLTDFLQEKKTFLDRRLAKVLDEFAEFQKIRDEIEKKMTFCRLVRAVENQFIRKGKVERGRDDIEEETFRSSIRSKFYFLFCHNFEKAILGFLFSIILFFLVKYFFLGVSSLCYFLNDFFHLRKNVFCRNQYF